MSLLEVDGIHTYYGNIEALKGVSLTVEEGEIVTLIGSNGAGKSTTLRSISGLTPRARARSASTDRTSQRCRRRTSSSLGIAQSPEGRHCFPRMTVRENLDLGAFLRKDKDGIEQDMQRVFELFPRLQEREKQKAGTMSGGEQQMLAIGRALMGNPKLLLLDEPSMGIAPILVERIYETIVEINRQGMTILLVEQNANYALEVSSRGYVLETGVVALEDASESLRENPQVQAAYLGGAHDVRLRAARHQGAVAHVHLARVDDRRHPGSRVARATARRPGLATGLLLSAVRPASSGCWCPSRADSAWKRCGVFGRKQPAAGPAPPPGSRPATLLRPVGA